MIPFTWIVGRRCRSCAYHLHRFQEPVFNWHLDIDAIAARFKIVNRERAFLVRHTGRFIVNPSLNFRHTLIAEYIYLDQRKAAKRLDRRIRQVRRSHIHADGRTKQSPEARVALQDLETVRDHITGSREALIEMRFYGLVYGPPARTREEKIGSIKVLDRCCEAMVTAMKAIPGVEAAREEPDSVRAIYHRAITGEADRRPTGREITEVAGSLAALVPVESAWAGSNDRTPYAPRRPED